MALKNIDVSLILCFNEKGNTNIQYFCGFSGIGILVIKRKSCFLIVPEYEMHKTKNVKIKIITTDKKKRLLQTLGDRLKGTKIKRIGIEEDKISVYMFKRLKKFVKGNYTNATSLCSNIKMIKENKEIDYIKHACNVTDKIYSKICKKFKFKTEDEIREFIEQEAKKANCELAFPPITSSGKGTSIIHYEGSKKISTGFLMLDFGVKYKGYNSDMTRMLYIGKPRKTELENYNLVLDTLLKCEKSVGKIKKCSTLHKLCVKLLGDRSEYFTHALGHGIGLEVHEPPAVHPDSKDKILNNQVFTIEPGIYFPNKYGIRIEDTVLYKDNKLEILTKSKKDLVIIK